MSTIHEWCATNSSRSLSVRFDLDREAAVTRMSARHSQVPPTWSVRSRHASLPNTVVSASHECATEARSRLLHPKRVDESRNGGWLLLPTRVIQEEARERRTPIF